MFKKIKSFFHREEAISRPIRVPPEKVVEIFMGFSRTKDFEDEIRRAINDIDYFDDQTEVTINLDLKINLADHREYHNGTVHWV